MAGHLSKDLCAAAFLSITVVALAGGCNHQRSKPEGETEVSYEVSQALVAKEITIRGKFSLRGKIAPYIMLDNQQVVYLKPSRSFTWGKPYSEMEGQVVTATGILRSYHAPPAKPTDRFEARSFDFFYFELETAQVQLISH